MIELETKIAALLEVYQSEVETYFLDALAFSGRLGDTLARQTAGEETFRANTSPAQKQPTSSEIEAFYRSRIRQFAGSLHTHARALGFASWSELADEVRKIYEPLDQ
jgi:hypothetical protein